MQRKNIFGAICYAIVLAAALSTAKSAAAANITRIEPLNWYAGMKNPSLQLMIYGDNIGGLDFAVNYPGVSVDSVVRTDSPNYLIAYLNISGAKPGEMTIRVGNKKLKYQLLERQMSGTMRNGFSNADVLYQLMPDRFASGLSSNDQIASMNAYRCDRSSPSLRHGGDLEGIRQHLDYFNQLGITALWLTPILENNSPDRDGFSTYHGYAPTDFYHIDPRFGSNDDYRRLTDEAHQKGLKIVMDMIFNHCGFEHPWVKDMPMKDWFNCPEWLALSDYQPIPNEKYQQTSYQLTPVRDPYASQIDLHETLESWFVPTMPDLNQHNPHVMRYLVQNSIWWIEAIGIDGIRMDTYPYAYGDAMSQWMSELLMEYPNYNVVGETWVTEPAYTASWQKDNRLTDTNPMLPTVMDFAFYDRINQAVSENTNDYGQGMNRVYNSLVYDFLYPEPSNVLAFIENHDTDRFLHGNNNADDLKQALSLLLTINRIPQLYYGVEILMSGDKKNGDGNVRKDFPGGFPGDTRNAFTANGRTADENAMFSWLSRLLHWRLGNDVVINGKMTQFIPHNGIYVVTRQHNGKTVMTIINGTPDAATMPVRRYAEIIGSHTTATDVLTQRTVDLSNDLRLNGKEVMILEY